MTKEQIEADICVLDQEPSGHDEYDAAVARAVARLRAELAKLKGPAEGFVRVRIGVAVDDEGRWLAHGSWSTCEELVRHEVGYVAGDRFAWITDDIPLPRVVEIDGTVET